jgi:hypothetical protein
MPVQTDDRESYAERELPVPSSEDLTRWFVEERQSHGEYFSTRGVARWCSLQDQTTGAAREPVAALAP